MQSGSPLSQPRDPIFPLLVPLTRPGDDQDQVTPALLGVLALGARRSEQAYARDDQALLAGLADQAGMAIHVAQLVAAHRAEAVRREESERQLAAYRASPMGRAEVLAGTLVGQPEAALAELHRLAQQAGYDPEAAALLGYLPQALAHLEARQLADLAQGVHYLVTGQATPEVLPAGVRMIVVHLDALAAGGWPGAAEGLARYRLCRQALEAQTIAQIVELLPALRAQARSAAARAGSPAAVVDGRQGGDLADALGDLEAVAEALAAHERVERPDDRLAYLASAIERLGRVRRDQGSADRALVTRLVENWLAVVTGAMRAMQTSARLICTLLTRQSWQSEVVTLGVQVRNSGRAAALGLQIGCDPAPEYAVLDAPVEVPRLAPGEEIQVELRVQPRLPAGTARFRARFTIHYGDPREPQGVEVFADVVTLLPMEGPFLPIANPYVVGTPLGARSPLFVGRSRPAGLYRAASGGSAAQQSGAHRPAADRQDLAAQATAGAAGRRLPVRSTWTGRRWAWTPVLPTSSWPWPPRSAMRSRIPAFPASHLSARSSMSAPAARFEHDFLPRVRAAIGARHLLLLLDEFEELEAAVRRGALDAAIFAFLRHLIQHTPGLSVIFCGTHRLEELAADYWHVLFNIALYRSVGLLERAEAERLIQEPVAPMLRYEDLALEKIWQVTAGHPYFLQLLCHEVVQHQNRQGRGYVTIADVNAALEQLLASGEAHMLYLWNEASAEERLALSALASELLPAGQITARQVCAFLEERGMHTEPKVVDGALQGLVRRQVLGTAVPVAEPGAKRYSWRLGLLGMWVGLWRPLDGVIKERSV